METNLKLSASRLKTFQSCSWQYYCRYVLKLPDIPNNGALMGTECHTVFECLLNPRHRALYDTVMTAPASITNAPVIERHVRAYMRKHNLQDELFDKIDAMIIVGLSTQFFCSGGQLLDPELAFNISSEKKDAKGNPRYVITGLIDKPAIYNDKFIRIVDYKSSKKKFEGDDLKINVQAMMYSLAAKKLWPHLTPIVDFIFLQFGDDPIQRLKFNDKQLAGFELFLEDVFKQMQQFDYKAALGGLAAKQKMPGKGGGFKGPLLCGFAKEKGQLKKDGSVMFACPYKWDFDYYALCGEDGSTIKTSFTKSLTPNEAKGEFIIKKKYPGCPHFKKKESDVSFL